jgi:cytochrome c oxidase subunit 2
LSGRLRTPARTILLAAIAAGLALAWAAPADAISVAPEEAHSPNADAINSAYWVLLVVVVAVIVVVNAALIAAVLRFRERRGREPARFAAGRGALRPVVGALSVLAIAIFVYGVIVTDDVREIEPSGPNGLGAAQTAQVGIKGLPASAAIEGTESATGEEPITGAEPTETSPLQIDAIAQQWLWRFEYPGGQPGQRTFSYGELVVPVDTTVILDITSTDVLHTWWVPALGGQVQAAPGDVSRTWFKADEEGRYEGRSTTFAGTGYPVMRAWVRVVSVPEYQDYVEQLGADLNEAQGIVQQTQEQETTPAAAQPEGGQ